MCAERLDGDVHAATCGDAHDFVHRIEFAKIDHPVSTKFLGHISAFRKRLAHPRNAASSPLYLYWAFSGVTLVLMAKHLKLMALILAPLSLSLGIQVGNIDNAQALYSRFCEEYAHG